MHFLLMVHVEVAKMWWKPKYGWNILAQTSDPMDCYNPIVGNDLHHDNNSHNFLLGNLYIF